MERGKSKPFVSDSPFDWTLVTTTVSLAYTLGLNLDPGQWQMAEQERAQRTHLWWMVYIQERWFAATMGRPVLIKEEDFDVLWPKPSIENGRSSSLGFQMSNYFSRAFDDFDRRTE